MNTSLGRQTRQPVDPTSGESQLMSRPRPGYLPDVEDRGLRDSARGLMSVVRMYLQRFSWESTAA